jgi:hypothetical protein
MKCRHLRLVKDGDHKGTEQQAGDLFMAGSAMLTALSSKASELSEQYPSVAPQIEAIVDNFVDLAATAVNRIAP